MKKGGVFFMVLGIIVLFVVFWFLMMSQIKSYEGEKPERISWDAAKATVAANRKVLCESFNNGAFEKIGPLYMEDAILRSAEGKLFAGPDEIVNYWKGLKDQGVVSIEYTLLALFPLGQIDYTVENVRYNHVAQEFGRYTFNRVKEEGSSVAEMSSKNGIDYHQEDCPWRFGSEEHP